MLYFSDALCFRSIFLPRLLNHSGDGIIWRKRASNFLIFDQGDRPLFPRRSLAARPIQPETFKQRLDSDVVIAEGEFHRFTMPSFVIFSAALLEP